MYVHAQIFAYISRLIHVIHLKFNRRPDRESQRRHRAASESRRCFWTSLRVYRWQFVFGFNPKRRWRRPKNKNTKRIWLIDCPHLVLKCNLIFVIFLQLIQFDFNSILICRPLSDFFQWSMQVLKGSAWVVRWSARPIQCHCRQNQFTNLKIKLTV